MTETVEELQAQLIALNKSRANGVTSTSYEANGVRRTVSWKSDIEMRGAQMDLQQRIAALQAGGFQRTVVISTNKGFRGRRPNLSAWKVTDGEKLEWARNHRDD